MARPRKIERITPEWPKIRRRERTDGTATWMVDTGGPVSPTVGRIQKTFRTQDAALTYAATIRTNYANNAQSGFGLTASQRIDAEAALSLLAGSQAADVRLAEAVQFYLTHHRPASGDITLSDLRDQFVENRRAGGLRSGSLSDLERRTLAFVNEIGETLLARQVTSAMVRKFVGRSGISPRTARNDFVVISAMFAFAMRPDTYQGRRTRKDAPVTGWIAANPCASIPKPHTGEDVPPAVLSIDECIRLLRAAHASRLTHPDGSFFGDEYVGLLPYVALGLFAGLRPSEIARLDWNQIHLDGETSVVAVARSKTRAGIREVELCPTAVSWLRECPAPHRGPVVASKNFQKRFRKLCELAKIETWRPDCMRHTFASCHYRTGQNAAHTAAQLGHAGASTVLFTHYRNSIPMSAAKQFWQLTPDTVLSDKPANVISITAENEPLNPSPTPARKRKIA